MKSIFNRLPKKLSTKIALLFATLLGVAAFGAITVANSTLMEGNTRSLNVTRGQNDYQKTTNASDGEVVQVQVWLHNRENPNGERANNTVVKIGVPQNQPGTNQNITGTITSDNFNTVTDTTTVVLDDAKSSIEYIPGTAMYRYNKGAADGDQTCETGFDTPPARCYTTVKISDSVISGGVNLDSIRKTSLRGCNAHHETVTVQVRVKTPKPGIKINKQVRVKGASEWKTSNTAKPGETVEYLITYQNAGTTTHKSVEIRDNLPPKVTYVSGSTKLINTSGTKSVADGVAATGIKIGNYLPGAGAYVMFEAKMPTTDKLACGTTLLRNVAVAQPEGMNEFYNTADTKVTKTCEEKPEEPKYVCESLDLEKLGGRKIRVTVKAPASNGATFKQISLNFGDGSDVKVTDQLVNEYEYAMDGTYSIAASVTFTVDGKDKTVSSDACTAMVTFETPESPEELPKTGAGSLIGLFTIVTLAAAAAHSVISRRVA